MFPIPQAGCVTSLEGIFLFYRWYSKRSSRIPALDGIYIYILKMQNIGKKPGVFIKKKLPGNSAFVTLLGW